MSVTKVKLSICGSNYVVSTTDSEEYVQKLAERLDEDMSELMAQNASASVTASAIITALSYLDEISKNAFNAQTMREQMKEYLEDAAKARMAEEEARRELEKLQVELSRLKEQH